ncbi:hypothetical protein VQH23_22615 [Pararoseomonas sp. SCSIO 73927]|uniref:hypothetical protein n=1 Tax=Pararoseomonas sp. SCSIO 73927 TaxID=3114537 RepID=UPI0030CD296A
MNEVTSEPTPRRPWERPAAGPAAPWSPPPPDPGPVLTVRVGTEDEVAASRLVVEAMSPRGGLGSAIIAGLLMLTAVTVTLATVDSRLKSPVPEGVSLLAIAALIAACGGLGWLVGAHLLPLVRRRASVTHARRVLRPGPGGAPPDGGGPARVVLGERALHWTGARIARRFDTVLLRGLVEDRDHMVLRFGLVSVAVLPRRDLTPDQQAAVRDWVARHAREGRA